MKCPSCDNTESFDIVSTQLITKVGNYDLSSEDALDYDCMDGDDECDDDPITIDPEDTVTCKSCEYEGATKAFAEPKDYRYMRTAYQAMIEERLLLVTDPETEHSPEEQAEAKLLEMLVNLHGRVPYITDPTTGALLRD